MLFEPVSRSGARLLVETCVSNLGPLESFQDYQELQMICQRRFTCSLNQLVYLTLSQNYNIFVGP
jgi:hypothetical protein